MLFNSSSLEGHTSEGISCETVRFVFRPFSKHNEGFARQYRYSTRVSPRRCVSQASFTICRALTRRKKHTVHFSYTYTFTCIYKFIGIYIVIMSHQGHNNIRNGIVWVQTGHSTCTCTVTLHVIETRTNQKFESFKRNNFRSDENRIRIC